MGIWAYHIKIKCQNCGFLNDLSIKKGIAISEFLKSNMAKCKECGCTIQSKIGADGKKYWEYETEFIK